jgi:hypothetical protein
MIDFTGVKAITIPEGKVKQIVRKSDGVVLWKSFTNQIPLSINSDKTPYVGSNGEDGYNSGYRLNSSGTETAVSGIGVTGFIPIKAGDIVYLKNVKASLTTTGGKAEHCYLSLYDSAFTHKGARKFYNVANSTHAYLYDSFTSGADGYVSSFRIVDKYNNVVKGGGYMRISAEGIDSTSIITVNEPI